MRRFVLLTALCLVPISTILAIPPQPRQDPEALRQLIEATSELEFQASLNQYVYEQYLRYGDGQIEEEKYLIGLMHLVNGEMRERLDDPGAARTKYFESLEGMLGQVRELEGRLEAAGIRELETFTDDLEKRIEFTLEQQQIDFKKKKVFEDALQMLYVSEEMIKLDRPAGTGEITRKIDSSKDRIMSAFGEVDADGPAAPVIGPQPSIYDLFVEWKRTDRVKFALRLADVRLVRRNLLKTGGMEEIARMFNAQLEMAYLQFNLGEHDLSERLLADLIDEYPAFGVKNLDDVHFYRAESQFALGHLMHARESYETLIDTYPGTTFLASVYGRLVQIHYTLDSYGKAVEYAGLYQNVASPASADDYYDVIFFQAMAHYAMGSYDRTVEALLNIPRNNPYYHLAQYFAGNAYADSQLNDEAAATFLGLVSSNGTPPYIRNRARYKLGILEYERGNYVAAIDYLSQIPDVFDRYDKVLNALAWSYFENERSRPIEEPRDFDQARFFAQTLNDEYYASPYRMEATGLLAYINQLENSPVEAVDLYRDVYEAKVARGSIEEYLAEKSELSNLYTQAQSMRDKALRQNDRNAFLKAHDLALDLEGQLAALDYAETSATGLASYREIDRVIEQIKELNALRLQAEQSGNQKALARIDSLQFRLTTALDQYPAEVLEQSPVVNLFDDYPVSKYVAEEELRHDQMVGTRQQVDAEIAEVNRLVASLDDRIAAARRQNDYTAVNELEARRTRLEDLRKDYDRLLVAAYDMETSPDPYPEFNRWGDLGAFGIINVYFDQKQNTEERLVKVADVLDRVNNQLNQRKQVIESKIKKIEAEIRFMTMKARMEERARLRAERERAFRESYFDTRESETPEEEN